MTTFVCLRLREAGCAPVALACDLNPMACSATLATASANGVGDCVDVVRCDMFSGLLPRLQVRPLGTIARE